MSFLCFLSSVWRWLDKVWSRVYTRSVDWNLQACKDKCWMQADYEVIRRISTVAYPSHFSCFWFSKGFKNPLLEPVTPFYSELLRAISSFLAFSQKVLIFQTNGLRIHDMFNITENISKVFVTWYNPFKV